MGCAINSGRARQCHDAIGGIKEVLIGTFSTFEGAVTFTEDSDSHLVASLPTATIYRFSLDGSAGHGSFTENITRSLENGTTFYEGVLEMYLPKITEEDQANLRDIAPSHLALFVRLNDQDANGKDKILYVGADFGAYVNGTSVESGTNFGDRSGYNLTIRTVSRKPAYFLEAYTSDPFDNYTDITVSPTYS